MKKAAICILRLVITAITGRAQSPVNDADFKLALLCPPGQTSARLLHACWTGTRHTAGFSRSNSREP